MSLLHSAGFNNDLSNNADLSVTRMRIQDRAGTVSMVLQSDATTLDMQSVGPITIDSSTGAISIGSDAVAQPVRIGTGAAARVITIGSAASA